MANTKLIEELNRILSGCSYEELRLIYIFAEGYTRKKRNAAAEVRR